MIIITIIFNAFLPLLCTLLKIRYNGLWYFPMGSNYLLFAFVGYYLDQYEISKKLTYVIYVLGIFAFLTHLLGTWYLSYKNGVLDYTFKEYENLPSILYSISVYLFVKKEYFRISKFACVKKVASFLGNETLGIYLVHYFLIEFALYVIDVDEYSILYRIVGGFVIFIVSALISKLIHKIPILKHIC